MASSTTTVPASTERRPLQDLSRWSGAVFALFLVAATATAATSTNPYSSSAQDYAEALADDSVRAGVGRTLALVAVVAFLWALARLRLALTSRDSGVPGSVIGPAGTLFVACIAATIAAGTAVGSAVEGADAFAEGGYTAVPDTALVLDFVADGFFWTALVAAAVLAWGIALAARTSGAVHGWVVWIGLVLVPLLPIAWVLFMAPLLVFAAWFAYLVATLPTEPRMSR